jgi:hypothetical protein
MEGIKNALAGKKTYIVAGMIILLVVVEKVAGIDVPGYDAGPDWFGEVLAALGLSTLRAGIGKA